MLNGIRSPQWIGPNVSATGCFIEDCDCEEKQSTLSLVSEQQVDQLLNQIIELEPDQLPDIALEHKIMEYALKEIAIRNTVDDETGVSSYHIDVGPTIVLDERKFTHEMWINRLVELLNVREVRQAQATTKIKKLLDEGVCALIGEVPSQGSLVADFALFNAQAIKQKGIIIKHSPDCQESLQQLSKQLKFDYNKIDEQGSTALDKLIQSVEISDARLKLFQLLTQRDAKIASTTVMDLENFRRFAKEKFFSMYQTAELGKIIDDLAAKFLSNVHV